MDRIVDAINWWGFAGGFAMFVGIWIWLFSVAEYNRNDGEPTYETGLAFIVMLPVSILLLVGMSFVPLFVLGLLGICAAMSAVVAGCFAVAKRLRASD